MDNDDYLQGVLDDYIKTASKKRRRVHAGMDA